MNIPVDYAAPCQSAQLGQRFGAAVVSGLGSGEEVAMGNLPKQPGDAVLSRDGSVKVDGKKVGYWEYDAPDIMPPTYHFSYGKGGEIVFSRMWKHHFKAQLPFFIRGEPIPEPKCEMWP